MKRSIVLTPDPRARRRALAGRGGRFRPRRPGLRPVEGARDPGAASRRPCRLRTVAIGRRRRPASSRTTSRARTTAADSRTQTTSRSTRTASTSPTRTSRDAVRHRTRRRSRSTRSTRSTWSRATTTIGAATATATRAYSLDGGKSWSDSTPRCLSLAEHPYGAARQYWQGGGDTSVAFDTKGNAYLSCQMFMRGQARRRTRTFRARSSSSARRTTTAPRGISRLAPSSRAPAVDGGDAPFLDKQLMTVDNHVGSPFQDRVYVTWTTFAVDGTAYIWGAWSNDYAEHFSAPVLVSTRQRHVRQHVRVADAAWPLQREPVLAAVHRLRWRAVRRVGELQQRRHGDGQPQPDAARQVDGRRAHLQRAGQSRRLLRPPDCATYQGAAPIRPRLRAGEGATTYSIFRATNYPSGAVNPTDPSPVVVTYGSYINSTSKESNGCMPAGFSAYGLNTYTGVKTAGACNNKILLSVSTNGGAEVHRRGGRCATRARRRPSTSPSRRAATSSGSGRPSTRTASSPSPTTTASTAPTR